MMNLQTLSPVRVGMLKGSLVTAMLFTAGIGAGLFFLHRKHEDELDKLEKDTAMTCLDFAAEHYEGVIRRDRKAAADQKSAFVEPTFKTPYYEEFLEYQRTLDSAGKHEPTEEEWAALEQKMMLQQKEHEELLRKLGEQTAQADVGLDRLKLKLLAKKAQELADKASLSGSQTPDVDSGESLREIDAMNNYEEPEE